MRLKIQWLPVFFAVAVVLLILVTGTQGSENIQAESSSTVHLPIIVNQPPPTRDPIFVGLTSRWDGRGYIYLDEYYEPGTHRTQTFTEMVDNDIIKAEERLWYDPNPIGWDSDEGNSYYSVSTGWYESSSVPDDPSWKWGYYLILPYQFDFSDGETAEIDGQQFRVTGPHNGVGAFGQHITYWRFVNLGHILYRDNGDITQYVYAGDATLEYDINTRLLLLSDIKRHMYYLGDLTPYTGQYIAYLTSSNAYPIQNQLGKAPASLGDSSEYRSPSTSFDIPAELLQPQP